MRFAVSQSYNIREATIDKPEGEDRKPFSALRFDLDSRIIDPVLLNTDFTFDLYDNAINTFNFEVGLKPANWLMLLVERRYTRRGKIFLTGTLDVSLSKGWRAQYSTRYDEKIETFRENDISLLYDNKCKCWGFSLNLTQRNLIDFENQVIEERKFLFTLTLRGIGSFDQGTKVLSPHRRF